MTGCRYLQRLLILAVIGVGCAPENNPNSPRTNAIPATIQIEPTTTVASPKVPVSTVQFRERGGVVHFAYRNGREAGKLAILESLGGGAAVLDFDLDGQLDLYLPGGGDFLPHKNDDPGSSNASPDAANADFMVAGRPGGLYRQIEAWQFALVTAPAAVQGDRYYSHGAAAADADNDGFTDLLITGYGGLQFYRNQGDGTFHEEAAISGLTDSAWSTSAAWGDLNDDGNLDLYLAHYVNWSPSNHPACHSVLTKQSDVCPPKLFAPLDDVVYFSRGDGTYRDVTEESGFHVKAGGGKGLGVLIADLDLDGRPDVYVCNDTVPNFLFHNAGAGHFSENAAACGAAVNDKGLPDGSMGVDLGDFDLDGRPDLWVSNYELEISALYRNLGQGIYRHVSESTGVAAVGSQFVGWGTIFFDVDGDGDEDVFVSNGHAVYHAESAPFRQYPLLFENLNGRRFQNIAPRAGTWMSSPHPGRGCAAADLDDDGDVDLVVSQLNEPVSLLENTTDLHHHWFMIRLIGTASTRDASGARVVLKTALEQQSRQIKGGSSYASSHDRRLHFGLGTADRVDSVEIYWPSGRLQTLSKLGVDRQVTVIEPYTD